MDNKSKLKKYYRKEYGKKINFRQAAKINLYLLMEDYNKKSGKIRNTKNKMNHQ